MDSGAIVFGYDNNGNRVTRVEGGDTTTYDYDVENRLVTVTLDDDSEVTMGYDAAGARVWRAHGTDSTRYIAGMVEEDLDTGATTGYRSLYGFAGTPAAVVDHTADTVVYPMGDHLGSIVASFDDTSNTVATMRYDPWGGERGGSGALPTDHQYTGQVSDATSSASGGTGLLFYNARHYDPAIGAFAQADTIIPNPASPASFNRYAYVTNNPVKYTDPSGHNNWDPTINPGNNPANAGDAYGVRYRVFRLIVEGIGSGFGAHELLDLVGIVPVIGEAADVINAGLYAAEGDWTNAGISMVAAVGGDILKGARYADDAGQLATHIDDVAARSARESEHMRLVQDYGAGGFRELGDGRIRYYGQIKPASRPGEMLGARLVREWNSGTNRFRTWYETLDHSGTVRQVHPYEPRSPFHYMFDEAGDYVGRR